MVTATERTRKVPRPRADALRNRERIVAAAREMFVEFGSDVPLDEIARRAEVGNATLYRHFADRGELIREVVCTVMDRASVQAERALAAALVQAQASEACVQVANLALQVHGGIGFTWEHPLHLYLKRARSSRQLFGTALQHRQRIARLAGLV